MAQPVVFPDAVDLVIDYLRARLPTYLPGMDVTVAARVLKPRPEYLVVVRRLGGEQRNVVTDEPQIVIESWAETERKAYDVIKVCRALIKGLRGTSQNGTAVYRVQEYAGPAAQPDPESNSPRYIYTVQLALRGSALI